MMLSPTRISLVGFVRLTVSCLLLWIAAALDFRSTYSADVDSKMTVWADESYNEYYVTRSQLFSPANKWNSRVEECPVDLGSLSKTASRHLFETNHVDKRFFLYEMRVGPYLERKSQNGVPQGEVDERWYVVFRFVNADSTSTNAYVVMLLDGTIASVRPRTF